MSGQPPGLGRLVAPDSRDHPLRAAAAEARPVRTKTWPMFSHWLDQGQTGTCVAHGWRHLLTGTPRPRRDPLPTPFEIYDAAILVDEWDDNDRDPARQFGTSVRAGAKVLQARGLIAGYGWAGTADEAAAFLSWHGPLVAGVNWFDTMFERDAGGFLRIGPTARVVGGHAFLVHGWSETQGAAICLNSWDTFGRFLLAGETLARLLREDGELCAPQEAIQRAGSSRAA